MEVYLLLNFCYHPPIFLSVHNRFTRPNDGWTGVCIKSWLWLSRTKFCICYFRKEQNGCSKCCPISLKLPGPPVTCPTVFISFSRSSSMRLWWRSRQRRRQTIVSSSSLTAVEFMSSEPSQPQRGETKVFTVNSPVSLLVKVVKILVDGDIFAQFCLLFNICSQKQLFWSTLENYRKWNYVFDRYNCVTTLFVLPSVAIINNLMFPVLPSWQTPILLCGIFPKPFHVLRV